MRLVQITGPESNSGKTITSMVLLRMMANKGLDIRAFKCGPDYIDSILLSRAGKTGRSNLDIHLMGEEGMKTSLSLNNGDYGLLEGAMGYFDGIGTSYRGSAYDIGKTLDVPAILVYKQRGEMFSIIPKIKGMMEYSNGRIKGVIFADTSKGMYRMLEEMVRSELDIEPLGYIEHNEELGLMDVELGLEIPENSPEYDEILDRGAERATKTIDWDKFIDIFNNIDVEDRQFKKVDKLKVAIASDSCFNFHYEENIKLLEEYFNIVYFSPLKDKSLPDTDLVIVGGGRIGDFKEQLSDNKDMLKSIKEYFLSGGYLYTEAGGTVYMTSHLDGYPMVNILDGESKSSNRLQNFGYNNVKFEKDLFLGDLGTILPGHEYHRFVLDIEGDTIFDVEKARGSTPRGSGYSMKNGIFSMQYFNFAGNESIIQNIYNNIKESKCI